MNARPKQRPEALAQFAETDRDVRKKESPGLVADAATSRPPLPIEADELDAERELQRLRDAQLFEGEEEDAADDEVTIDVTLEDDESLARIASLEDDVDEDESDQS